MRVREITSDVIKEYIRPLVNADVVSEECRIDELETLGYALICDADVIVKNPDDIAVAVRMYGDTIKEVMVYDTRKKRWIILSLESPG